ncbi:GNAT family acetyltransferase [Rhodonellum psychrophilum GCM71 = DSM 17998]|uniref:GNAT family acetyltransferase n=2 Tax=Rhodonellum TaxID=336827 RepID=U5C4A8_9BACT|nr:MULTISPECIES: GNAT family N-acetyltransferase [Rhodonellum]ERM83756.1 GNAT family acetyltransferase [Rhodonellum psychrophilum GCM71 = DSM 17998]MDO9551663.1 GNAT family N-acetyltransferase [Rhodonellum sp.]SDY64397.1 L-amino acid N-acyltransferase YncA [Rhodonellum ikkaensis]
MYTLRAGKKEDLPRVLELVKELALYEKAPEQVTNTIEMMEKDGFGPHPVFGFFVAQKVSTEEIIGIAIYYYRYSTWKGKRLYLEDIVVTESERGHGAGKLLFDRVMKKSLEENCTGMMWQVLDWNSPAINFYNKYGADLEGGWLNCHLQSTEIRVLLD